MFYINIHLAGSKISKRAKTYAWLSSITTGDRSSGKKPDSLYESMLEDLEEFSASTSLAGTRFHCQSCRPKGAEARLNFRLRTLRSLHSTSISSQFIPIFHNLVIPKRIRYWRHNTWYINLLTFQRVGNNYYALCFFWGTLVLFLNYWKKYI